MKTFNITVPVAGYVSLSLDARDEQHAKELLFNHLQITASVASDGLDEDEQLETYFEIHGVEVGPLKRITSGNCLHVSVNEIYIEEEEQ